MLVISAAAQTWWVGGAMITVLQARVTKAVTRNPSIAKSYEPRISGLFAGEMAPAIFVESAKRIDPYDILDCPAWHL